MANSKTESMRLFDSLPLMAVGAGLVLSFAVFARWYQSWAAWDYGLDASTAEFQTYWMKFLYIEVPIFAALFVAANVYLWMTRDRDLANLAPRAELKRYVGFLSMLFVYAFAFVFAGSFFGEQDAAWHQVVSRDTSFTPSHIVIFYGMFPMFIVLGFASYSYAVTRLPLFSKGVSIPLIMVVIGPFMVMPNVGFNEWGHAFWIMEERFTLPLHYGFVIFGWAILALGGLLVQVMSRVSVLMADVFGSDSVAEG